MEAIINKYYENNAKKLNEMVDKVLKKLNFVNVNKSDFYSLSNEIFFHVIEKYDKSRDFDGFLYSCLCNKFKTEMTRQRRQKRKGDSEALSTDEPVGDDGSVLGDFIPDKRNIDDILFEDENERVDRYLDSLSPLQRKIIEMKMDNIEVSIIMETLHITSSQYEYYMSDAKTYPHVRFLHM